VRRMECDGHVGFRLWTWVDLPTLWVQHTAPIAAAAAARGGMLTGPKEGLSVVNAKGWTIWI
jgi:hypothetical protein